MKKTESLRHVKRGKDTNNIYFKMNQCGNENRAKYHHWMCPVLFEILDC